MNLKDVLDLVFSNDAGPVLRLTMLGALAWLYRRGQEPEDRDPRRTRTLAPALT